MIQQLIDYFTDNTGDAIAGGAGLGLLAKAYSDLGTTGSDAQEAAEGLASALRNMTEFKGYTVTGPQGGQFTVGPDGQYTVAMSPEQEAMSKGLFGQASGFLDAATVDPAQRTQDIYGNMMTAMRPDLERQNLMNEERMAAQGRLGVSSNMYGGMAPETFQLNRAQQEAMNNAYFAATQQAAREQAQLAGLGAQYMGLGYMPQREMLPMLSPGLTAAAQRAQQDMYGTGLFAETRMGGIEADLAANIARGNIIGEAGTGLLAGIAGGTP